MFLFISMHYHVKRTQCVIIKLNFDKYARVRNLCMIICSSSFKYGNIGKFSNAWVYDQLELREMEVQTGVLEHSLLQV